MSKGVIIFVEGDTEEEIYHKFIEKLQSMSANVRFAIVLLPTLSAKELPKLHDRLQIC